MNKKALLAASLAAIALFPVYADAPKPATTYPSPGEIVNAAPATDWKMIAPSDLLVMDLKPDASGKKRQIIIQLMPAPFSQGWIGNIRKLAAAHWWDGTTVYRVQDNYVAQWGDADGDDAAKAKKLPDGLATMPESKYVFPLSEFHEVRFEEDGLFHPPSSCPKGARCPTYPMNDLYDSQAGFQSGWPFSSDGKTVTALHCYGAVGVARDMSPNTGSGSELYTVIGHAPRHLDRNIAIVGRIIEGMENLSSLPRGTEALGIYKTPEERVPILSVRLGNELPAADQPKFEYLATNSDAFKKYADARENRRDPFFIRPAGGADICNIPVPIRRVKA